ncbi:MAG: carbon-nitrogen hydrolase family protein [Kiritimatiellia bacterium]|nr:carbon-nitrogen hydrolase family protein [Kiritimatiellia bacterium]MDP6847858.1 carbon-nitrogen hydrolase family protein [Kiritimatiellia bacterium]
MKPLRVALMQLSAGTDVDRNLAKVDELLGEVSDVDLVALPEVFSARGKHDDYVNSAEPIPGPATEHLSSIARRLDAWILAGSIIEESAEGIYNTSVLLDRTGAIAAQYRKIHLFEAVLDNGQVIKETDTYKAGDQPVLADIEGWKCGMSICYDLRFPEMYRHYALQDAHLLFVPANFTQRTGRDHWETLVRARAIENQCFVVAPDQCGTNPSTGVVSHGHSMVVGPWGEILCCAGDAERVITVELDPKEIAATRARIPVIEHRKLL